MYKETFFENAAPVTIKVRNATVADVLGKCLQHQPFTFKIEGNAIVIAEKPASTLITHGETIPPIEIKGNVKDENGNPLADASVIIKGATRGVTTNNSGDFTINVPDNKAVLVISYLGYVSQEIVVGNRTAINIKLLREDNSLSDIVVTALGINRAEKSLTYSAQVVGGSDLNIAKETNLINSLQGKVSGVVISRSATGPGGSSKVLLRGNRSITGGNEPLYIIDGVPLNTSRRESGGGDFGGRDGGGGISMLNPDNIESMTVLKGASAAALYGSAGQNGAIVITTKSGKSGKIKTEYDGGIMTDKAFYLPEFQSEYGQGDGGIYNPNSEHSYGPKTDSKEEVTLWNGKKVPYVSHTDNMAKFLRTGTTYNNTITATGGSDKIRTFFSYGNVRAAGILRNNDMTRHNIDLKIDNNITSKLSITAKVSYIYQELNNMPKTGEQGYAISSIYRAPLSIPLDMMKDFNYFDAAGTEFQNYWKPKSSILSNPYWDMYREPYFEKKDRALGLFVAKYKFTDWIDFQVRGSIDKTMEKTDERYYNDTYTTYGVGSTMIVGDYMRQSTNVDALLSVNRDLTKDLNLDVHAGGSVQQGSATSMTVDANGLYKQNYFFLSNAKKPVTTSGFSRLPQVQSLYGMATLGYKNTLFLDITARNDWSSALPKESWSYFYPSAGLSGIISEMMTMPDWINYGKLRVSYAQSGAGGGAYRDRYYYGVAAGGGITVPATKSLPTYKPELTSSFEVGAEWWFLKRRVGFDFTYYTTDTKNQLITITTPPPSLFSSQYINAGLINNHGVEATLYTTPVRTANFEWNANFNFSKNKNKIIRLSEALKRFVITDQRGVMVVADEGKSFGEMYGTGWRKDSQGRHLVDTAKGLPLLTGGKTVYLGNYNPDFNAGFANSLHYKNFTLDFLITYSQGGTVTSSTQALLDADGHSQASLWGREGVVLDAYYEDGRKNTKTVMSQDYFGKIGERYFSGEFYSYSATNIRLREMTLGYNFSGLLKSGGFVKTLRFYLVGRNLFFFKNEAPFDPEMLTGIANWGGVEYTSLPTTRSLGFNLKLTF